MKKYLLFGAVALVMTACSSDDGLSDNNQVEPNLTSASDFAFVKSGERLVFPSETKAATRAAWVTTPQPAIPATANELISGGDGGIFPYEGNEWWNNGGTLDENVNEYYVPAGKSVTVNYAQLQKYSDFTIYVEGELTISSIYNSKKLTFNILKGGKLILGNGGYDYKIHVDKDWTINCWGAFSSNIGDYHGLRVLDGGEVNIYEGANDFVIGDATSEAWDPESYVTFQVDNGTFYSEVPVRIMGSAKFFKGTTSFMNGMVVDKNVFIGDEGKPVVNVYECSYIYGQFSMTSNSTNGVFNVYDYLYCGSIYDNGAPVYINLYDALLDVSNNFETVQWYKQNRLVDNEGGVGIHINGDNSGDYASVVRFLNNDLYIHKGNAYDVVEGTGVPTKAVSNSFSGNIVLLSSKVTHPYPKITGQDNLTDVLEFADPNVALNAANAYLPAKGDCRPQIGEPQVTIIPPVHKYSATSLDFGPNGELYLSWHSNIGNEVGGHGTNMYVTNLDGSSVSVDGIEDWGGIIDIINTNNYGDPKTYLFDQTLIQNEHKYNHVIYNDGKLYLPSTSKKVGAALHEIALNSDGTIDEANFSSKNVRVNLTGSSANCCIVNNSELITISGFNNGAINKFALTDYSNQEKKAIVDGEAFAGKYVYSDGTYIITLNDVANGTVSLYTQDMVYVKSFNVGTINPTDGKNVCIGDGQNIYVCRSNNGFEVYDYNGNRVGGSKKSANGVDVDSKYIYVASGLGLVVLDKAETYTDGETVYNKTVKRYTYTGTGNARYNNIITTDESKQSANFVKVVGKKAYVAYGMYGLQIYDLSELYSE